MIGRLVAILLTGAVSLYSQQQKPAQPTAEAAQALVEDVAVIKATLYRPATQRDPFAAPQIERPTDALDLIEDISIKGMIHKDGSNFAVISDSRGNVRWLPVGHRFKDGEITAVTDKAVTFHQWEVSTTNRSVFRTITKTFKREEGKR